MDSTDLFFLLLLLTVLNKCEGTKPNIVFIVADDLGWNDVGFHGSNQIPTPNIDALATSGLILHNYYVTPICTPSRSAVMTGKYPIHTGMQHRVLYGNEPRGLPLTERILPQYLKDLGYKTHLVGKWHLGSYKKEYLPMSRGFDSHFGYWTGKIDLFDHTTCENGMWGFDFRRGYDVADDLFGKYATDVYTDESIKVIESHNKSSPLFLMLAHTAVHSGNPYEPLRAPDEIIDKFNYIEDTQRRKFAAMLWKLDESVGRVVESLQKHNLLENSIIIFSTDNGGPAEGFNDNAASNWPLKGVKNTLWEGGVRGAGAVWSPLIKNKSRVAKQRFHLVDWLPTLLSAVGGNSSVLNNIDGIDQWRALSEDLESDRKSLVHNIDDILGSASITSGKWKVHKGTNYGGKYDAWYGPSGRRGSYNINLLYKERAGTAINQLGLMPDKDTIKQMRVAASVDCNNQKKNECKPLVYPCLFNIEEDPCEHNNLANEEPDVLEMMLKELDKVNKTAAPPNNKNLDPRGDPKLWGRTWTNFGDYVPIPK